MSRTGCAAPALAASCRIAPAATPKITPPQLRPAPSELAAAGFGGIIGEVNLLSLRPRAEEQRFGDCEVAIQAGCQSIVEMGLALARAPGG